MAKSAKQPTDEHGRQGRNGPGRPRAWGLTRLALLIILLGFFFRWYSFLYTPVINTDGVLYIQQAKAIYHGEYDRITACYPYISSYPLLIAAGYGLLGDWVKTAEAVSLLFGTLTLIPLYWLLRRFFDENTSVLSLLLFALSPPFVDLSRDVIRDPIYWFFSILGIYLFVLHLERRRAYLLAFSSFLFVMGAWARVEGLVYLFCSAGYLLLTGREKRWQDLLAFCLPLGLAAAAYGIYTSIASTGIPEMFSLESFQSRLSKIFMGYRALEGKLNGLSQQTWDDLSPYFFPEVRKMIWLISFGSLVRQITRAFFFPFFLVFLLGTLTSKEAFQRDSRLRYLVLLCGAAFLALYAHILTNWAMTNRFIALFLFPAFVFVGHGVRALQEFLARRVRIGFSLSWALIFGLVFLVALPKNLKADHRSNKEVFREVGEFIAARSEGDHDIQVAGGSKEVRLIHFYAHAAFKGAPCFERRSVMGAYPEMTLDALRGLGFDYYVWDEENRSLEELEEIRRERRDVFRELNTWDSGKLGRLVLFRINPSADNVSSSAAR